MTVDRMNGKKWQHHSTYLARRVKVKPHEKEELQPEDYPKDSTKSITVPGQSQTIKELMQRYEKGRPIPVE